MKPMILLRRYSLSRSPIEFLVRLLRSTCAVSLEMASKSCTEACPNAWHDFYFPSRN